MRVYEGSIVTGSDSVPTARFLVEDGGRILHVGDELPPAWSGAERVALGAGAMIPALADTHLHFMSHALFASGLDVRDAPTVADLAEAVRAAASGKGKSIVLGFGASAWAVAERRLPSREELDAAAPDRPVFIVKYDGHAGIANSAFLARLPSRVAALRGWDAASGLLEQEAFFAAVDFAANTIPLGRTLENMLKAIDGMAGKGIGMVHSVTGVGFPLDLDVTMESVFARGLRNELPYRVFFQTMDVRKALSRKLPRIGGCFATALDGCFGSADAALLQPYTKAGSGRGVLYYDDGRVRAFARDANRAGLQIQMHAIGDAAFGQAVDAIASALDDTPRWDHRHTVIHACLPTERGLDLCARLGIILAVQPAFLQWKLEPLEYLEDLIGDRAYALSPLKSMLRRGITLTGGSDAPCTLPDPLAGIAAACDHYVEEESLSFTEALALFTRNAALGSFDEKDRGTLEKGKIADFVLLNADPLALKGKELRTLRAEKLYLSGRPYRAGQGIPELLARAAFAGKKKI